MGVFQHWPNRITALRFVGALVLFSIFALYGESAPERIRGTIQLSFWLFVVVAATDVLDGWLARQGNLVSAFGRIADPFVDKVLILGAMVFMTVMPWSRDWFPAWLVVVILAREFLVTGIRSYVESVGLEFPADWFGKVKMIVQCSAVGGVMWLHAFEWTGSWLEFWRVLVTVLVVATLITTVASGFSYVFKMRQLLVGGTR